MALVYIQRLRLFSRDVRLFLGSAAMWGFAQDGISGVLLNLYLLRLGFGPQFVGLMSGTRALAFTAASLPAGAMGTRWGTRRVMIAGMTLLLVASALVPLAESLPSGWQEGWFLTASSLDGVGRSLFLVSTIPFLMTATGPEERNHAFSIQMALVPLAIFAGSLVGGVLPGGLARMMDVTLDDPAPYRIALLVGAVLLVPAVAALLSTSRSETPPSQSEIAPATRTAPPRRMRLPRSRRIPLGLLLMVGLLAGLRYAGQATALTFFNVYLDEELGVSTALIGVLKATAQLLAVPAALSVPVLLARWSKEHTITIGSLGQALSQVLLALVPHWGAAGVGLAGTTALFSLTTTAYRVFSQELVQVGWRTAMSSALMMGGGLSLSLMSFFGGFAIAALGYTTLFLVGAGLTAVGTALFWAYFRKPRGTLTKQA